MWDDEDVEDEEVKELWEDEELKQVPKQEPKEEKTTAKPAGKAAGKKTKQPESKVTQVADEVLADPVAEKLRQQRRRKPPTSQQQSYLLKRGMKNLLIILFQS